MCDIGFLGRSRLGDGDEVDFVGLGLEIVGDDGVAMFGFEVFGDDLFGFLTASGGGCGFCWDFVCCGLVLVC